MDDFTNLDKIEPLMLLALCKKGRQIGIRSENKDINVVFHSLRCKYMIYRSSPLKCRWKEFQKVYFILIPTFLNSWLDLVLMYEVAEGAKELFADKMLAKVLNEKSGFC